LDITKGAKMSIRLIASIFDADIPELKTSKDQTVSASAATFVLLAIADHANDNGEGAYPAIITIAQKTKLTAQTVIKAIDALELAGYLEKLGKSRHGSTVYRINPKKITTKATLVKALKPLYQDTKVTLVKPSLTIIKPIAEALSDVTGIGLEINEGYLYKQAKELLKDERISPELIRSLYSPGGVWYKNDFRGKLGQAPTVSQIMMTINQFLGERSGTIHGGVKTR
jgi:DNA-binding MarR family transcriptional regulator